MLLSTPGPNSSPSPISDGSHDGARHLHHRQMNREPRETDHNDENDNTTLLDIAVDITDETDDTAVSWIEEEDPWRYPPLRTRRRVSRNEISIPGGDPCIPLPCLNHKRRIGKLIVLHEQTNHGRPKFLCVIPACWPMLIFTECLIGGISLGCYYAFLPYLGWFWWVLSVIMLCYVCGSLFKTATSDPGIVPRVKEQPDESWVWSERAQSYHAPDVVFCNESGILVREMDHFCPWTGTTIAGGNIKYFYMFLSGVFLQMMYVVFLMFLGANARNKSGG